MSDDLFVEEEEGECRRLDGDIFRPYVITTVFLRIDLIDG